MNTFLSKSWSFMVYAAFIASIVSCKKPLSQNRSSAIESFDSTKKVFVYTTADSTNLRLSATDTLSFKRHGQPFETETCVFIDPSKSFQTFLGIGGAITDAAAETFAKLSIGKQDEFVNAYFHPQKGIGYSIVRTNINSCDFSSIPYTYVTDGDKDLKSFDVAPDRKYKIPLIQKAIVASNRKLTTYASPWSPPAWMKDNNDMLYGGKLKKEFYQSWANYFVKFIKSYEAEGIPIWGLTVQNEPMAKQKWESCIYTAEEERDFVKNFLGPTLKSQNLGDRKLIVWDHNRDLIYQRASTILDDPEASKYVWGIGFHWYEPWSGGEPMFDNIKLVNESYPDKHLLFTEGCQEAFAIGRTDDWKLGERYGNSMIRDFNNGTVGWTDWNILLDETGGPNHAQNFCLAPIHGNTKTSELIYTNAYYYIGHFSKFIKPGAKRVQTSVSRSSLLATAFENVDGSTAVVVMNTSSSKVNYILWIKNMAVRVDALAHSISTLVIK